MPFIGNQPAKVPLTSADITDGIIGIADLSATGTKDSTTFLRGDNTFAAVSSDFVRIATTTVSSSVSTVDFTSVFTSTYDRYIITIDNLTISANAYVSMRVIYSTNTVDSTTVYTQAGVGDKVNTSGTVTGDLGLSNYNTYGELYIDYHQAIASGTGTAGKGLSATIHLSTPANTTNGKAMTMQSGYFNESSEYVTQNSFWYYRSTNAITGLRFYPHSGNFTSATISIYGLKKS